MAAEPALVGGKLLVTFLAVSGTNFFVKMCVVFYVELPISPSYSLKEMLKS